MCSDNRSIRLPDDLAAAADKRAEQLGYANFTAYLKAVIRQDILNQGNHAIGRTIAALRPEARDKVDAGLLESMQVNPIECGKCVHKTLKGVFWQPQEE